MREAARKDGTLKFTALLRHVDVDEDYPTDAFFDLPALLGHQASESRLLKGLFGLWLFGG